MLVDTRQMLLEAQAGSYAIGAFNTYNLEITQAIIHAAESMRTPVILQIGASALAYGGTAPLSALVLAAARAASVPVAVHLDHACDHDVLARCLALGFSSVMFDGSSLPLADNIKQTRQAAQLAHDAQAPLEAELGALPGKEDGSGDGGNAQPYTDPAEAACFVKETAVDSLAVAIGNQHGFYKGEPLLDFERLTAIRNAVDVPLVLHGASGIPDKAIRRAIQRGICKINVNTDLRYAFFTALTETLRTPPANYPLAQLMKPAIQATMKVVIEKITLFGTIAL